MSRRLDYSHETPNAPSSRDTPAQAASKRAARERASEANRSFVEASDPSGRLRDASAHRPRFQMSKGDCTERPVSDRSLRGSRG